MITVKSSVLKQHLPAPKVLNPLEANPTFMLQPKPLDGAVRNSLTSSSSESCLVFRKSALIFFKKFPMGKVLWAARKVSLCLQNLHRALVQQETDTGTPYKGPGRWLRYFAEYEQATLRTHKCTPASPHQFHFLWGETVLDPQYGLAFKKINRTGQGPLQGKRTEEM